MTMRIPLEKHDMKWRLKCPWFGNHRHFSTCNRTSQIKGWMPINTVPMKTVPIKTEPIKTVPIKTEPIQDAFQGWELRILGLKSCRMLLLKRKLPRFLWRIKNTKLETPRNDLDYNNYCLECKYISYYWHLLFVSGLGQCYDTTVSTSVPPI